MCPTRTDPDPGLGFRHEATFYDGGANFVSATAPFIREGLAADERILAVLTPGKIGALQAELGPQAGDVTFADMAEIGRNPARIIPAWQDFLVEADGAEVRGIGEPIWADRSPDALLEAERHEALLNVAFDGGRPWRLLCPYDEQTLAAGTLRRARRNHPILHDHATTTASTTYPGVEALGSATGEPLSAAPSDVASIAFAGKALGDVRTFAGSFADTHGFRRRSGDVRLVAQELSSNSVRHGGGRGTLRIWTQDHSLVVEVRSGNQIVDPLAGRRRPAGDVGGYGLWIVNQTADLMQIRNDALGSTVRAHFV